MTDFVLVPGAWLGAWAWQDVTIALQARGHHVHPLTLTGLAERSHLGGPDTDLDTHITDVTDLLETQDLRDAVLVGHSYAGLVVAGAADRAPQRLRAVVYVDSAPLPDGNCLLDLVGTEEAARLRDTVASRGDGWRLPFPGWDQLAAESSVEGLSEQVRARVADRATPQPFATYTTPLRLTGAGDKVQPVAIACGDLAPLVSGGPLAFLAQPPWTYRMLDTGHWPLLSEPEALADLLDEVSSQGEWGA